MGKVRTVRLVAFGLIMALLCVSSATRIGHVIDPDGVAHHPTGFVRAGGNIPHTFVAVKPDLDALTWIVQPVPLARPCPVHDADEVLPDSQPLCEPRAARPPPAGSSLS
jgi:hypothetical protein